MFDGFIEQISQNANRIVEGDYIKDGLYYCHKCNTAKQYRLKVGDREFIVNSMCKCAEAEAKQSDNFYKAEKLRAKKVMALGNRELLNWTFENDDGTNEKLKNALIKYCDQFSYFKEQGKGLMLYGPVGTGKTFATAQIVNRLVEQGRVCKFTSVKQIVNDIQGKFDKQNEFLKRLNDYELLVLDDFSAERKTEYMQECVYNIVNSRYMSGLPLIITTNLTAKEIKECADITFQRTYSRISEMCHPILVDGADRRKKQARADYETTKGILGI